MRNVVLVCLDSVRKDFYDRYATRLQERTSIDFEQCRAASGWSVPSHASMLTGELPHRHGIHVYNRDFSGLEPADTFLGDLPEHRALGASANVYASEAFGFDTVFDEFVSASPDRRLPGGIDAERFGQECDAHGVRRYLAFLRAALAHDRPLQSLANGALVEIDDRCAGLPFPKPLDDGAGVVSRGALDLVDAAEEPFFLFTNFMDAHGPLTPVIGYDPDLYDAPPSWSTSSYSTHGVNTGDTAEYAKEIRHTRELYGAAVEYLDRRVASLIDRIQSATDRETVVVVTADHGENLAFEADQGLLAHKGVLTEGLLHVPCAVIGPSEADADPATIGANSVDSTSFFSHCRLGELIVALGQGDSLPAVTADAIPAERIGSNMAESATAADRRDWDRMIRVVYEDNKYRWDSEGDRDRYRLDPDRPCWEKRLNGQVPVDDLEPRFFDSPIREYKQSAIAAKRDLAVNDATEQRLRDLGYV